MRHPMYRRVVMRFFCILLLAVVYLLFSPSTRSYADELEIRLQKNGAGVPKSVEAAGFSKQQLHELSTWKPGDPAWSQLFAMYVVNETSGDQPPAMLGRYRFEQEVVRFTPRYALKAGLHYRVVLRPRYLESNNKTLPSDDELGVLTKDIVLPKGASSEPGHALAIYPSANVLPENLLRLYIHFSVPMSRGEAYRHVRLLDTSGKLVDAAFLEIGEELWDASAKRLTLLMDPGRVKRGLKPREDMGPAIESGNHYVIEVDAGWKDAHGQPLAKGIRKPFEVGPPQESALDTKTWKLQSPPAKSRDPLIVRFPGGLDQGLLERTLTVEAKDGTSVDGRITIEDNERRWTFQPNSDWMAGNYDLVVDTTLEDPAGNRIGRPFEVDQFRSVEQATVAETVRLPFRIGESN